VYVVAQAAFSCIDSILEHLREKVGASFLPRLRGGLQDENPDVQMLCHQLIIKLAGWPDWHPALRGDLDKIVLALDGAFRPVAKAEPGKGDVGRSDLVRSAVRAVEALSRVSEAATCRSFAVLYNRCVSEFAAYLDTARAERSAAGSLPVLSGAGGFWNPLVMSQLSAYRFKKGARRFEVI
jgi:hypothetical protein